MGGDYTRFTFDPVKGYSGVHKQQGRVSLDSDFNEFEEILDRRGRATMYDIVGQAVVPATTPDGFKIGVSGAGLSIGPGRTYVDGILVECFGPPCDRADLQTARPDPHLGGLQKANPIAYEKQPFSYQPGFPDLSPRAGDVNLVYLDVWQREVTVLEDEDLREPALNGPDTATRIQTAWQVKSLSGLDVASCADSPEAWTRLTAPSTARLSTHYTLTASAAGPCIINPAGGYTGLENRLYRVEIQTAGNLDGSGGAARAQFKWSRDNGSLAAKVTNIDRDTPTGSVITVGSTGRDAWQRFAPDDHLELLDDAVEFALRESGSGGLMATVNFVDHATGEIHVNEDLTAFNVVDASNPRVRRWDVADKTEALVRDVNRGTPIPIEEGIAITFDAAGEGMLHAGDYWVFAARTADGSIDILTNEPPRGVLHHYSRLALVTSGGDAPSLLQDCRVSWPPRCPGGEGCCTVVVHPGDDIQHAIDSLRETGGCVCLKMGIHEITGPLSIQGNNLTLHGEVPWVTVRLTGDSAQALVAGPTMRMREDTRELVVAGGPIRNVGIEGIMFEAPASGSSDPLIELHDVFGGHIADCGLRRASGDDPSDSIGVGLARCRNVAIERTLFDGFSTGIGGESCESIRVIDNLLQGPAIPGLGTSFGKQGIVFLGGFGSGAGPAIKTHVPSRSPAPPVGIAVERNLLVDYRRGIQLGEIGSAFGRAPEDRDAPSREPQTSPGCRVAANVIVRHAGTSPSGIPFTDPALRAALIDTDRSPLAFAIATAVARCELVENAMNICRRSEGGILTAWGKVRIARNDVVSSVTFDGNQPLRRAPLGVCAHVEAMPGMRCTIRGNRFRGFQQAVFASGGGGVEVLENEVAGDQALRRSLLGARDPRVPPLELLNALAAIRLVQVQDSQVAGNRITAAVCAVLGERVERTRIVANHIADSLAGVLLPLAVASEARENIISNVRSIGLALLAGRGSTIAGNTVSADESGQGAVGIGSYLSQETRILNNRVSVTERGIVSILDTDAALRGNDVADTALAGIATVLALHEITIAGHELRRCGYRSSKGVSPDPAIGIEALYTVGRATVAGCHVLETGEARDPQAPIFTGARRGILVDGAIETRVHGCTITSKPLAAGREPNSAVHPQSRGIAITTFSKGVMDFIAAKVSDKFDWLSGVPVELLVPSADVLDTLVEQSASCLVEIVSGDELMFATNRCTNMKRVFDDGLLTVELHGDNLTVTGNRVRTLGAGPSIRITAARALAAIGNMSTGGAEIGGAAVIGGTAVIGGPVVPASSDYPSLNTST